MEISRISNSSQTIAGITAQQASAKFEAQATSAKQQVVAPPPDAAVAATSQAQAKEAPIDPQKLKESVEAINKFLNPVNSGIEFSIDEDSGRTLVKVVDTESKEILRQFPSKEALAIAKELDKLQGLLIRDKA